MMTELKSFSRNGKFFALYVLLAAVLLSCGDAHQKYVRKAVHMAAKVAGGKHSFLQLAANQPFALPGGDHLVLTTGCDVARTGEVFCDDPIEPDVLTEKPLEDALEWINY